MREFGLVSPSFVWPTTDNLFYDLAAWFERTSEGTWWRGLDRDT